MPAVATGASSDGRPAGALVTAADPLAAEDTEVPAVPSDEPTPVTAAPNGARPAPVRPAARSTIAPAQRPVTVEPAAEDREREATSPASRKRGRPFPPSRANGRLSTATSKEKSGKGKRSPQPRLVTWLVLDVSGSTALAAKLNDPEVSTSIMNEAFELLSREIVAEGGTIEKYIGDCIQAVFGSPEPLEHHESHAIRAGLKMVAGLERFSKRLVRKYGLPLRIRTGVGTGADFASSVGAAARGPYTGLDETLKLAGALEQRSQVGRVRVSQLTYEACRDEFDFEPTEPFTIGDDDEPVRSYFVAAKPAPPSSSA